MKVLNLAATLVLLLNSCQSSQTVQPFPQDEGKTQRWLEIGMGNFGSGSRVVVTEVELVAEYYERANRGRNEGRHQLKTQERTVLPPALGKEFWRSVDGLKLFSWSDYDIQPNTAHPSLSYRHGTRKTELHSSESPKANGKKFEELESKIGALIRQLHPIE